VVKIGWAVTGGLTLLTSIVLLVVFNKQETRAEGILRYEQSLDKFRDDLMRVDLGNEQALKQAKDLVAKERTLWRKSRIESDVSAQLSKINTSLQAIEKTRGLVEQLSGIEKQLGGDPSVEDLAKLFTAVRDADLGSQAADAGGTLKTRYDEAVKAVTAKYITVLQSKTAAAAQATTGEALAPFGQLEDTLRAVIEAANMSNDIDTKTKYGPIYTQVVKEVNEIATRLFDDAYVDRVPWKDLLADAASWTEVASPTFTHKFGGGLQLSNAAGEEAQSGGLSYTPGSHWRDYVIEAEVKLDSGTLVFYARVGDKMDAKMVPAVTFGTKNPNVAAEYGKTVTLVIRVIGRQIAVSVDGAGVYGPDDITGSKSRKGEPGIVAQAGTNATITRLRVRHLR